MAYPTIYPFRVEPNDTLRAGALAGRQYWPRECTRFAIYPVHHREMDERRPDQQPGPFWFVADGASRDNYDHPSVVAICDSEAAAFAKLRTLYISEEA